MDLTHIYAIAIGGVFSGLILLNTCRKLWRVVQRRKVFVLQHLIYPLIINRHYFIGPWTRVNLLLRLIHLGVNVFLTIFKTKSIFESGVRAGTLALINMIPLFFGLHLSFLADLFGISLKTYRCVHAAGAFMSFLLGLFHVILGMINQSQKLLSQPAHIYGIVCVSSLTLLVLFPRNILYRFPYEIFIRSHQTIGALAAYSVWRHIQSSASTSLFYVYVLLGIFTATTTLETLLIIHRNFVFHQPFPRAKARRINDTIQLELRLPRQVHVSPGDYINLWIPGLGLRSLIQTHPFTITSWRFNEDKTMTLNLLIEARSGLTNKLQQASVHDDLEFVTLFSGPHGTTITMGDFGTILMFATDIGIAAQLSYLRKLIDEYNQCRVRTRRIHLIWQLRDPGDERIAESIINAALEEDKMDKGYILRISCYYQNGQSSENLRYAGTHGRVTEHYGSVNLEQILEAEIAGEHFEYNNGEIHLRHGRNTGEILIAVSATTATRDEFQVLIKRYLKNNPHLRYLEMEYQPSENRIYDRRRC